MKFYFSIILLFSFVCIFAQTTMEEWRYMTKGYSIQKESGLDMKKGYELKKLYSSETSLLGGVYRKFNFIDLFRSTDNSSCGIIVEYVKTENGKTTTNYFGIPTANSSNEIWNEVRKLNLNFANKDLGMAYSWALVNLISNNYLETQSKSDCNNKEKKTIDKANAMNGLFGNDNSSSSRQGNSVGKGSSGGNSWSLNGRNLSGRLVTPSYNEDVDGRITVNIRVDQSGRVTSASIGSPTNISDSQTRNAAITAAQNTRFSSGKDISSGSITYNFKLK